MPATTSSSEPAPATALPRLLVRVQRGLEEMYRIATGVTVEDFVVDAPGRDRLLDALARRPREQLLIRQGGDELSLGLFIDAQVLANLEHHDPGGGLGEHNFSDFLLALEGVSHFVYTVFCAHHARAVSALELELQAEVDKYVTCLLMSAPHSQQVSAALRRRLFADPHYELDLDADEASRYQVANDNAQRYAAFLEDSFVRPGRVPQMLAELRRFYRRPLAAKLATIARAA
jgi:hypothetical protein